MIFLHEEKEKKFDSNGFGSLDNAIIIPIVHWTLNGEFTFEFNYLKESPLANEILADRLIEIDNRKFKNIFRIKKITEDLEELSVFCEQVSSDLIDNLIEDINIVNKTGDEAIKQIGNNTQYKNLFKFSSNINRRASARLVRVNPLGAILDSSRENSFVSRWGGEIQRDGFNISMLERVGENRGVKVQYGKNLVGYERKIDSSDVATRIMPIGFDGLRLPEKYVDSLRIDPESPKIRVIRYEDVKAAIGEYKDDEDAIPESEALDKLRELAKLEFSQNQVDLPRISYSVDFIQLSKTKEYELVSDLQEVNGGDIVEILNVEDNLNVLNRVIEYEYDPITEDYLNMILGDMNTYSLTGSIPDREELTNMVQPILDENNSKNEDRLRKVQREIEASWRNEDGFNYELKANNEYGLPAGYYSFNKAIDDNPTEVVGLSAGRLVIANKKNSQGQFEFNTFGTGNGFVADLLITGYLKSLNGYSWLDLDNGALNFGQGDLTYSKEKGMEVAGWKVTEQGFETTKIEPYSEYTKTDFERVDGIILGKIKPNADDYSRLDIDGDGSFTMMDYTLINYMSLGRKPQPKHKEYKIIIDPKSNKIKSSSRVVLKDGTYICESISVIDENEIYSKLFRGRNIDMEMYTVNGKPGASGTFATPDNKTVTVEKGLVVEIKE